LKSSSSSSIWTPPKKGLLKLNFNGTSKSRRSSIGGVYGDHNGKFVLGYTQQIGRATICMTELVALKRGLELAVKNRWRNISIEGDFKTAVDAIASRARVRAKKDLSQWRKIAGLLPRLGKTTVSHVVRKGNKVAHGFAKLGYEEAAMRQRVWRDVPPEEVLKYLERDAQRTN
jgi:ribonuclease HI